MAVLIASLLSWFATVAPVVQQGREDRQARALPPVPPRGVQVAFLANEGFLLRSQKVSVLIDAFLKDPYNIYEAVPRTVLQNLVQAEAPFDGPTVALVSHRHQDHFQVRPAEKFLRYNTKSMLVSTAPIIAMLEKNVEFSLIEKQVKTVEIESAASQTLRDQNGITVTFIDLPHSGEENREIQNLGHLIEMEGVKILHVGDADAEGKGFVCFDFGSQEIDVSIVPYWYLGQDAGRKVVAEKLGAAKVIASHIPPKDFDRFSALCRRDFPDVIFFRNALESRVFEPRSPAAESETPKDAGAGESSDGR